MTEENHDAADGPDAAELQPGIEVGGYVIDGKIGQGGMGVVYGAHHPRIGKRVAIKVLAPAYSANPRTVKRFEQEARLVNEIKHPNIVDVFQFGELPDGRSYFVMEWLEGEPLTARIDRGQVPAPEMAALLDVVCDALAAAHEHGVVHRDLKSDNVFIVKTGKARTVKLLDFGLAKLEGKSDLAAVHRTRSGVLVGTPAYMAPEQARGKTVDARTDIYALGVLAYKMLTGVMPFKADNAMDLIVMHLNAPPPAPNKLARDTPAELSRLVVRMMAKDPEERPSLAEIRTVFAAYKGTRTDAAPAPRRKVTSVLVGMALFLAGVVALGAIWLVQRGDTPAAVPGALPAATTPEAAAAGDPAAGSAQPAATATQPAAELGSAAGDVETIEFAPDPVARGPADEGSQEPRRRQSEPEVDAPLPLPAVRPGSLILVLETASSIEIDGTAVARSSKGGRFEVAPGEHQIRVKAPGRQAVERTFEVEAGGTAVIRVADDSGEPEPAGSAAP